MKEIKGYEGLYEIAEDGTVYSVERYKFNGKGNQLVPAKIKTPQLNNKGYHTIYLWKNNKMKNCYIHRLVAEAYIPNPNNYPLVMHLDNNPLNNHISNLKWGTQLMNMQQAAREGRMRNQFSM